MSKKLETYIETLEARRKRLRATSVIIILIYLAALVLVFINIRIAAAVALLNVVFYFFMFRPWKKAYLSLYYEANSIFGLGRVFDSVEYDARGRLDYAEVQSSALLPVDGREKNFKCKNYLKGVWKGLACEVSEVSTYYRYVDVNLRDKYAFLARTWIRAVLNESGGKDFKLVNRHFLHSFAYSHYKNAGYREAEIGDKSLGDVYLLFVPQDAPGDYAPLSEECIRRLKGFTEKFNCALSFSVSGPAVNFFLHRRFYTDKILIKYRMDEEKLSYNRLPELEQLLKLARSCAK